MVYFDNAATTFPKPENVYNEIITAMKEYGANPGRSGHKMALKASRGIYETRELISKLFNIEDPLDIVLTFNATESLNLGIKGLLKPGDHVITTSMEHNSVLRPIKFLEKIGVENTVVLCDLQGRVKPTDIEKNIKKNTKLIVCTHMSNLTGTIMPIKEIGKLAKNRGIVFMVDAAQSAGIYDIDVKDMNIDLLAFPGHKSLLGPSGTGGLYINKVVKLQELFQGGTGSSSDSLEQPEIYPDKFESGTINAPGIVGLGAGIKYILDNGIENLRNHELNLTNYFIDEIKRISKITLYGPLNIEEQGPVVSLNIGNLDSSELSYILDDKYNIAVRPGLHCVPLGHKTIGTLERGAVRFSFGIFNTHEEIEYAIKALKEISDDI